MKCGTTSLHNYLNAHPDIFMSEEKELDFFIEKGNWSRGMNWYQDNFSDHHIINGESSQNYTKRHSDPDVAQRIYELMPNVKLIYIVRDPVTRIESHFKDVKTYGYVKYNYDINDVVKENLQHPIFMTSHYYYQIEPYLQLFPRENICFIKLEDLKSDPVSILDQICEFLGIEKFDKNTNFSGQKHNSSGEKLLRRPVFNVFNKFSFIKRIVPNQVFNVAKRKIESWSSSSVNNRYNELSEESKELIRDSLLSDLKKFTEVSRISYYE